MTGDQVRVEIADEVATITLNRPEARNALSAEAADELAAAIETAEDSAARCVVLQSEGAAFCAGGDVNAMLESIDRDVPPAERVEVVVGAVNRAIKRVYDCRLPTVAKIDGPAFGAGAGLAIACDLQLASPAAKISFGFRRVGLAVDSGVSYLLPRLVGLNTAKELIFTGELVDADRARDLGLVTRVFEASSFDEGVENIVETIATGPTVALAASKRLVNHQPDSFDAATAREANAQGVAFSTADHEEGARAFVESREPEFDGR
ncbi:MULTISPECIES: enoyl-CoA hydratase/isomerase family protein [Halomicrobium]|uniref:Enoyl-CoA hydratase/isomerase n=2 Tax=Halomicrobium mukohataei TaxID=57705 RepID=C7NYV9_HALMD|nr:MULTISPECIES: enoyl-CoA hydratase-related protein [Halomicrobium]ACV48648.1 Enoyl-CoA hydratase/isomerase [Halomicrobium mukohataei DSM 12286]QCD67047.1 enoyl-CoA hydratase [Halomicrobium mukohataei]QFR21857.1 enoyl-CoA hydratase [Halomicrobium sp. ZPS1]